MRRQEVEEVGVRGVQWSVPSRLRLRGRCEAMDAVYDGDDVA